MRKLILPALLALAVGAAAVYVIPGRHGLPLGGARTLGDVPPMSEAEAASHRETRYASLDSIEDLLALPGHFARMEGLYALAGRSDSAAVQNLIFQADGIADGSDRKDVLLVLFARLTALDAPSALALSRTRAFAADPAFEREVWRRWGGLDLEAALDHAAALEGSERNRAAQALFAAYDYWGSDETSRIAERLDVRPDTRTRAARVDELAYTDPAAAIEYVKAIESPLKQRDAAAHLGRLLGRNGIESADRWSALFEEGPVRRAFEDAAAQSAAEVDPRGTLEQLLQAQDAGRGSRLSRAFSTVAAQDLDQALLWFGQLESAQQRRNAGRAIAAQLAETDPLRALSWARDNDRGFEMNLYRTVIDALSEDYPELALNDVMSLDGKWQRIPALMLIADKVSAQDPRRAVQLMKTVDDLEARNGMMHRITMTWIQSDPDAALNWIMSSDVKDRDDLMATAAHVVARADVDAALRLLPRLGEDLAPAWRQQIAANLASQHSLARAESFIAQFEGTPEYPGLVAGIVQGLAQKDPQAAVEMLDRVPESANPRMLSSVVFMRYAQQSPREAAEAAAGLANDDVRAQVMSQVAQLWGRSDSSAAEQWADSLPRGRTRDEAIGGLSHHWRELTASRRQMLESIEDRDRRTRAIVNVVYRLAREDRDRAERALRSFDFPEDEEQKVLQNLDRMGDAGRMFIRRY